MSERDWLAGLVGGARTLGDSLNRRRDKREALALDEQRADAAQRRALALLAARPSKENTQVVTGTDEQGPGIFLVDKDTGTKKRITNEAMSALTGAPPSSPPLLRKPGDPMPVEAPPIPPAMRMPTSTVPVPEDMPHEVAPGVAANIPAAMPSRGLLPIPKPEPKPTQPHRIARSVNVDGKAQEVMVDPVGKFYDLNGQPIESGRITPYTPPKDPPLVDAAGPNGQVVRTIDKPGVIRPAPTQAGAAKIRQDVAANRTQIAIILDAEKELDKHPDAVGLARGVGEMVPALGGIQDAYNQRKDPGGVAARASLANIGSMVIKDRSGAAVTISEYPRLKPFIPTAADTPAAIKIKLKKLREAIELETRLLEESGGTPTPDQAKITGAADPEFDAIMATVKKKPPV